MLIDLTYNDLLTIAKLITLQSNPAEAASLPPSYFKGMEKALNALNTKLSQPEIYQFMREEAEKE